MTPELFCEWRAPRFGRRNPEPMNNPIWEWLVRTKLDAHHATEQFNGPSPFDAGPTWCFDRFGQSSTQLPDGRTVLIAGEHEDNYDPDFYIYNDVTVQHPDGRIDLYAYPREVFPPTDFHSATLVGNRIIVIGNLSYPQDRKPGTAQVLVLDLETFAIASVLTSGTPPGWIFEHEAVRSEDGSSILVRHGKLDRGEGNSLIENIDDWCLHLTDWRWERLTDRRWPRWEVRRKDGCRNHLWEQRHALWLSAIQREDDFQKQMAELTENLGCRPDLNLVARLYQPAIAHEALPELEDEFRVSRIKIDDVVVRYVEDTRTIQFTIEGDLPAQTMEVLVGELRDKMSALENAECEVLRL